MGPDAANEPAKAFFLFRARFRPTRKKTLGQSRRLRVACVCTHSRREKKEIKTILASCRDSKKTKRTDRGILEVSCAVCALGCVYRFHRPSFRGLLAYARALSIGWRRCGWMRTLVEKLTAWRMVLLSKNYARTERELASAGHCCCFVLPPAAVSLGECVPLPVVNILLKVFFPDVHVLQPL